MLQGACCSRPVYGHSHYKKFWLKKMESEDEQSRLAPESEYLRVSSERSGAFWRSRPSTGGNCSALELKGSTSGIRLSSVRSTDDKPRGTSKQKLTILEGTELECALALGLQMPHTDCFPPLKRSAFRGEMRGEEQKAWEQMGCGNLIEQNRDRLFHGGTDDSQTGRSRAYGDRDLPKASKEYTDPDDGSFQFSKVFGREEVRKGIGLASMNPPRGRAEQLEDSSNTSGNVIRTCAHCKTANTPLWRNGPNGPKTLCNACGIRYKKIGRRCGGNGEQQRSAASSLVKQMTKRKPEADLSASHPPRKKSNPLSALRAGTVAPKNAESARSFATDEEEGAALLMGLSCGLVNA